MKKVITIATPGRSLVRNKTLYAVGNTHFSIGQEKQRQRLRKHPSKEEGDQQLYDKAAINGCKNQRKKRFMMTYANRRVVQ